MSRTQKLDSIVMQLEASDSSYFCGSACFVSLIPLLQAIDETSVDFEEAFPKIRSLTEKLIPEDGRLFELAMKKSDHYDEAEWNTIIAIISDYASFLDDLKELIEFCKDTGKKSFLPVLESDCLFLCSLLRKSLIVFYDKEEQPELFRRQGSVALLAIEGETADEK